MEEINIKTLADLRRYLEVGRRINLVQNVIGPIPEALQLRIVKKMQSNSVCFDIPATGKETWLSWPKSKEIVFEADGFTINHILKYRYLPEVEDEPRATEQDQQTPAL